MDSLEEKVEVELTVAEERAQFEKEKLSRRQALARIGFQAGAAAIAALTADELLRKVGKEMQRRTKDHKVAQQVAKELSNAGVAFAAPPPCWPGVGPCGNIGNVYNYCRYHFFYYGAPPGGPRPIQPDPAQGAMDACKHCCEAVYGTNGDCNGIYPPGGKVQAISDCQSNCQSRGGTPFDNITSPSPPVLNPCAITPELPM